MRRGLGAVAACVIVLAGTMPAGAATRTVSMVDLAFSPKAQRAMPGDTVRWTNTGARTHTATQDAPLSLFTTGNVAPGATSAGTILVAAGVYPYHCAIHPSMVASIKVPVKVAPLTGTTSTTFTVTVASQAAPTGFVYDVQRRIGAGSWTAWRTGVTNASVAFRATSPGEYSFRGVLRRLSTGATSRPSPAKTVTVS